MGAHQQLGVPEDGPAEAEELPLADAERAAAFADLSRELVLHLGHRRLHLRLLERRPDRGVAVLLERVEVGADGPREEHLRQSDGRVME